MKKNRLLFFVTTLWAINSNAQLTLTKAANEPVAGDIQTEQGFDSVSVLPRNVGQNQTWDFSTLVQTQNSTASSNTYVVASSIPASSLFPGANLAIVYAPNTYDFYKSSNSQLEYVGYDDVGAIVNYTNSQIAFIWPIAYGYSQSDTYSGQATGTSMGTRSGNFNLAATGTGTLKLPGGQVFPNVLQVKITGTDTQNSTSPASTLIITSTVYSYYSAGQKFPLLSVAYNELLTDTFDIKFTSIAMNKNVVVGVKEETKSGSIFALFPNPAKEHFTISLSNAKNENCSVTITNALGQLVISVELGSSLNINEQIDLKECASGIYYIKTTLGEISETKKIVIQK